LFDYYASKTIESRKTIAIKDEIKIDIL